MAEKEISSDKNLVSDIHLRSEEVQEILSAPPTWMLKWGTTIIFFAILLLLFFAWLIKYPDVVVGQVKITTANPPVQLLSYTSGKIISLNKKDNEKINKDETIAIIENLLTETTSKALQKYIDSVKVSLRTRNVPLPVTDTLIILGELQPEFSKLSGLVKTFNRHIADPFFEKNINNLQAQINQYNKLTALSTAQINLSMQELENVQTQYKANKKLYENGTISKFDFMSEESKYIIAQRQVSDLEKNKIQNVIALTEYEKQLSELQFQHDDKLIETAFSLYEEINTLKNQLQQWEQQYVIKAPFSGIVSYLNSWAINKYIKQGEGLFTIVPDDKQYIGLALVPNTNFGKIQIGQTVNLKMDNYAYNELGELTGKIKSITLVPGIDNNYRIEIALDNGLVSTYKKQFEYKPDMTGVAQIITEDLSILDRIFYKFKKLIAR